MKPSDPHYIHGTRHREQQRLRRLNALLNAGSLEAMALGGGERILDVGAGLGLLGRLMAHAAGSRGVVVGVERDTVQIAAARRLAREEGEAGRVDFRQGSAECLPLEDDEWGTFDLVHARFLLEHVTDPLAVVRGMMRAVKPGGRVILEDDDHALLRLSPEPDGVMKIWRAYYLTYRKQGKDPFVGRHLVRLIHQAGGRPRRNRRLSFGSCSGNVHFAAMVDNFIAILEGARAEMVDSGLAHRMEIDRGLEAFHAWQQRPDAALWYSTAWAEGQRPLLAERREMNRPGAAGGSTSGARETLAGS
ncbi:MAG: class I SAM-dependent methyltransferase [Acidobacteriota bacterium]